jgi:hypothetical protein
MFKPIYDIIVDVETIGIFTPYGTEMIIPNAIFNTGVVVQHKGKIIERKSIGVDEFWKYPIHRIMDFYRCNFTEEDFDVKHRTMGDFLNEYFYPLLKGYKDKAQVRLWSYNADFDMRAFIDTASLENHKIPKSIISNWNCIMVLATQILLRNVKYLNWIVEQEYVYANEEFISRGLNARTKAETLYRYISNNPAFIEAHKGLDDATIEGEILEWCKAHKGWSKLSRTPRGGGWLLFNKNAKPFQSVGHFHDPETLSLLTDKSQQMLQEIITRRSKR